jgi:hypothetical protein
VLLTEDPSELAAGQRLLERYYGDLGKPFTERAITGSASAVVEAIGRYEAAGLDVLHLLRVDLDPRRRAPGSRRAAAFAGARSDRRARRRASSRWPSADRPVPAGRCSPGPSHSSCRVAPTR